MILQELVKYYERKLTEGGMAPEGFEYKEIPYLIEIDENGNFVRFISTWLDEKKKRARSFLVPASVKRANGIEANLLWDNTSYIFGLKKNVDKANESNDRLIEQKKAFSEKVKKILIISEINPIINFLDKYNEKLVSSDPLWDEIKETTSNLTFKLKSELATIVENKNVRTAISNIQNQNNSNQKYCLITGESSQAARLHTAIKGVRDAQAVGANIVSFNLTAFESYGKEQSFNAPVSEKAMFAYTTALNTLLSKDSHQKIQVGDATTVFWSEQKSEFEDIFGGLFETTEEDKKEQKKTKESQELQKAKEHFISPFTGKYKNLLEDNTNFFVLGLSPNAARISIRFWYPTTVGEISKHIQQHFDDMKLEIPYNESGFIPLYRILRSTALQGKLDNVNPLLAGKIMTSIISGVPYPKMLLSALLIRIKAEQKINFERVSIIKAIINRKIRFDEQLKQSIKNLKELKETMDESNINVAYRLGRIFAVMEKMQQNAIGGNITIKDSYYTSASTRPATVFAKLFALSNHHASKLGRKSIFFERLKGEILAPLDGNIPRTFSLEEQGLFAIGYYQQRNELFKTKEANTDNDDSTNQGENNE